MKLTKQSGRQKERGVAMMIALLSIVLLAIIGMAFMFMANTENSVNSNYKSSQKSYFASRGGLENVRALLVNGGNLANQAAAMGMPEPLLKSGVIYVFNGASDPTSATGTTTVTNFGLDDELCHEQFNGLGLNAGTLGVPCGSGPGGKGELGLNAKYYNTPLVPVNTTNVPFTWVRITNKQNLMGLTGNLVNTTDANGGHQVCWDGGHEVAIDQTKTNCASANPNQPMNPVWVLTSLSASPSFLGISGSRRMTQMEVALTPPIGVNATIATSGTLKLTGSVVVNGTDDCTTNNTHYSIYSGECVPGATGCAASITNSVPPDQLTGAGGNTGVTIYNSAGGVQTQGSTGQGAWPYNVDSLISQYKQMAQNATASPWNYSTSCSGNNCKVSSEQFGTFPTNPLTGQQETTPNAGDGTPAIVYVPGDLHLTSKSATGDGLLIVDGDLTVDGGLTYYGLILVKGQIHFTGGGSANVNVWGSVLAGDSASAADAVGGSFSFHYSSCALKQTAPPGPPALLATHEVMY